MHNVIIFVTGRKGCGKTSWARMVTKKVYARGGRVIAVAPKGGLELPGAPIIDDPAPAPWAELKGRSALVLARDDRTAQNAFCFAWELQEPNSSRPLLLVVDEIDMYLSPRSPDPYLLKIIRYGRHCRLSLIGVAQRAANVHRDLLAQADRRILFNTIEPDDLTYLRRYCGVDPAQLQALPELQYIIA